MRGFEPSWFVVGGWAIDLYLEKLTRPHEDIEIGLFRRDQTALQDYLNGWLLEKIVGGERAVWRRGEVLKAPVHEIHCFKEAAEPERFEVLLNEANEDEWLYRRNESVRRQLAKCLLVSNKGVRFLCPEAVLLYKSKRPRAKDELDFMAVVKHLDAERREWLREAIGLCDPRHHWLKSL